MFLGHYGVAFALKRVEPKISLGTLFVATQLVDLLWGVFLLLGWEHVVAPHAEAQERDKRAGEHHRRVAEERLPREDGQHLAYDTEGRKH